MSYEMHRFADSLVFPSAVLIFMYPDQIVIIIK